MVDGLEPCLRLPQLFPRRTQMKRAQLAVVKQLLPFLIDNLLFAIKNLALLHVPFQLSLQ